MNYLDRYFKSSIFLSRNLNNTLFFLRRNRVINGAKRIKFCAAVISKQTQAFRIKFINQAMIIFK